MNTLEKLVDQSKTPVQALREDYTQAKADRIIAQQHEMACIEALQGWCEHPLEAIREEPYREHMFGEADPPIWVCTQCGYTEQTWSAQRRKMATGVYDNILPCTQVERQAYQIGPCHDADRPGY
jgi:rubrerythrin